MTNRETDNPQLNILVLHHLGKESSSPHFLSKLVYALQEHFPNHQYLYHDSHLPIPEYIKRIDFDAIILDVTFLSARWSPHGQFERIKREFSFVKESLAVKIALPQDEYDCHLLLDDWLCEWDVHTVFSVLSEHWEILYPKFHRIGTIKLGYTGYIDNSLLERRSKSFEDRTVDIGYRARKLPPYFGKLGEVKSTIGDQVLRYTSKYSLRTDIKVGDEYTIYGEAWLDFLADSKFTLGTNSGSSLLDPRGEIQRQIRTYFAKYPQATYSEIETKFFPGEDGKYTFAALSPRNFETALMNSCQILVPGSYSGILAPWTHYIPIKEDASNFDDIYRAMCDRQLVDEIVSTCRSEMLDRTELRLANAAEQIHNVILENASCLTTDYSAERVRELVNRYHVEMRPRYTRLWKYKEARKMIIDHLKRWHRVYYFARKIRDLLRRYFD